MGGDLMLRQALRNNPNRVQTATGASIPAPVKGWDAVSPLPKMDPANAVVLDNWIPRAGYVEMRAGSVVQISGASNPCETLLVWRGSSTDTDEIYAGIGTGIYDANTAGAIGAAVKSGFTNVRFQYVNFSNDAGNFIISVNGADKPFKYDGSTWADLTITGSSGSITLDQKTLIDLAIHKERLFFVEKGTKHCWYLAVRAIQGAAQLLDLGPVFKLGGTISTVGSWSMNSGQGQDTYLAFYSTEGEIAIYQGTDPSDANYWSLVGIFQTGTPLGRRSLLKYGADLIALTSNGAVALSQALAYDRAALGNVAITARIQNAFASAVQSYGSNFGWQALTYSKGSLAIYNIPVTELGTSYQYVQNLQTGAWCRFVGLNAFCWGNANNKIYYGAADGVYEWDKGVTDAGVMLTADMVTAFSYFGAQGRQKNFTMIRPVLNATNNVTPAVEVRTDFRTNPPTAIPTVIADRSDLLEIRLDWTGATGIGYAGAAAMRVVVQSDDTLRSDVAVGDGSLLDDGAGDTISTDTGDPLTAQIQCVSFDLLFEAGGIL
jgi:hypothetical protein